eukprot:jgi/Hompol1/3087/HPOL_003117-RA
MLYEQIERENQALALDPKAVMVRNGSLVASTETMHALQIDDQSNGDSLWQSLLDDKDLLSRIPHLVSARARNLGIPPKLRGALWLRLAGADDEALEQVYASAMAEQCAVESTIRRDVHRTFPELPLFKQADGYGQKMLFNVLRAYSNYDREVGYCQGLSFCAGILLLQNVMQLHVLLITEVKAFALLVRLMEEPGPESTRQTGRAFALRSSYLPDMTGFQLALFQHSQILKLAMPTLYSHLHRYGVSPTMYAPQWFLTIFSHSFPMDLVFRILDIVLVEGAMLTILRFSIGILHLNQKRLLAAKEMEELLHLLKGNQLVAGYSPKSYNMLLKIVFDYAAQVVTPNVMDELKERQVCRVEFDKEISRLNQIIKLRTQERDASNHQVDSLRKDLSKLESKNVELKEQISIYEEEQLLILQNNDVL